MSSFSDQAFDGGACFLHTCDPLLRGGLVIYENSAVWQLRVSTRLVRSLVVCMATVVREHILCWIAWFSAECLCARYMYDDKVKEVQPNRD